MVKKLGAIHYIDSQWPNAVEELAKMGGAKVILGTVPSNKTMGAVLGGLGVNGKLIIIGGSYEPLQVPTLQLMAGRQSIEGWYSGSSIDAQDTLSFSAISGVRPMNEIFMLDHAAEACELMMSDQARFRAALTM